MSVAARERADPPLPKGQRVEVSVIIVAYNSRRYLERCLASLADVRGEVIVVDNRSTDDSRQLVRERFPAVRLIELPDNRGFGAASNEGMRAAAGRYYLIMNSDAWPLPSSIDKLVSFADRHPRTGLVGPRLLNVSGTRQRSVFGYPAHATSLALWALFPSLVSRIYFTWRLAVVLVGELATWIAGKGGARRPVVRSGEFVAGAVLLLRPEAVAQVGGFDERFFMFGEEVDLCRRIREGGWAVELCPEAQFVHVGGASTHGESGRMLRERFRSDLRLLAKHSTLARAERARRLLARVLRLRALLSRGERRSSQREAATWLRSADAKTLLAE